MQQIDAMEFQKHPAGFLNQVREGATIQILSQGRVFARLVPENREAELARARLSALRGSVIVGNILDPIIDVEWSADEDHL
ncbi:MAG: type II toxin-antitoxin system prevent-host-death family antitoxin [Magnetococcales bacterium]|nr:type II toxin-antitoxin system prevent-host-death family antitoxin [Magnetococcales bacterium]